MKDKHPYRNLKAIIHGVETLRTAGDLSIAVHGLQLDSREVQSGQAFVALKGYNKDGHSYIDQAVSAGAKVVFCENWPDNISPAVTYIQISGLRKKLGWLAHNFFGHPSKKLKMIAITGTNGKTSVATIGFQTCQFLGYKTGLISTTGIYIDDTKLDATHTTPDPISLHRALAQMADRGCEWCWMEASSHALDQGRTNGIDFLAGIFTNLSHDHLDYHGSFDAYLKAKKVLFDGLEPDSVAIVNQDDRHADVMVQNCEARKVGYALQAMADYTMSVIEQNLEGMLVRMDGREVHLMLNGGYNGSNVLSVYATLIESGEDKDEVLKALSKVTGAEGRFQKVMDKSGKKLGIVDFAHTPDAVEKILKAISELNTQKGRILTVIGCGGNRDRDKRPKMAKIAVRGSDKVVLTSDNPRSEKPEDIIEDMKTGVSEDRAHQIISIPDRREAIRVACSLAEPG
ncbi:MAG: UDP-N-acetylmuramoyl-L-alanyl-D-glutamate--2,6-diaminopimelate ligase, partial [Bacteroidetes bacterium]|nr:UDP-N-acetylmuramoyl-L-alanyl-D-glutamate--2,6-diaminopimelate ligase [Bacteroidota bacterium]